MEVERPLHLDSILHFMSSLWENWSNFKLMELNLSADRQITIIIDHGAPKGPLWHPLNAYRLKAGGLARGNQAS